MQNQSMPAKNKNGQHFYKRLEYKGKKVAIDKDILDLISKMWQVGVETTGSCHGYCSSTCKHKYVVRNKQYQKIITKHCGTYVYLAFKSCKDLEKLYNIVAEYDTAMYDKMHCDMYVRTSPVKGRFKKDWNFAFHIQNDGVEGHWGRETFDGIRSTQMVWIEDGCKKNNFVVSPRLTFPRTDIKYVEDRLDNFINRLGK